MTTPKKIAGLFGDVDARTAKPKKIDSTGNGKQLAFISGLGTDLPGQETLFDVDGLDGENDQNEEAIRNNIAKKIAELKAGGVVAMGLNNLHQVTPTTGATCDPVDYCWIFKRIAIEVAKQHQFKLLGNATVHTVAACEPPFQKRETGDSCATDCYPAFLNRH